MYSIELLASITNATLMQSGFKSTIEYLLTDSRKLLFPEKTIFFSLSSPQKDANGFIGDLYEKGVRAFVVDITFNEATKYSDATFLQTNNVLLAMQKIATYHRQQFSIPVIGITGSNGKTIVKEWLFQLLQNDYHIVRNPKSFNSQIGVPLSIWQINNTHTLGIFEAGISMPDEMDRLQKMIEPTIGIFTNIGTAHSEGFVSVKQKIAEKAKLFSSSQLVICSGDDVEIYSTLKQNGVKIFYWSLNKEADLQITHIQKQASYSTIIKAVYQNRTVSISIPFTDDASVENAISCWCVLLHLNIADETILERMHQLKAVEMRLELKQGINNCTIINDSYSADINSLTIALDFLLQQQQHQKRTVILSDILQSGKPNDELYKEVAAILVQKKIDKLIGIGIQLSKHKYAFDELKETSFYSSTDDFIKHFATLHFNKETILLKGARMFEFEQINHLLEHKLHQTVMEINLSAMVHNLKTFQQILKPGVKTMAMVKAFSYGSGGFEIANVLQFHNVDYLAVAYADEGVELRKAGIRLPIMVMNVDETTFDLLVKYNLEPELFSFSIYAAFENYLLQNGITFFPVHIKIDTGMKRLGFVEMEIDLLSQKIKESSVFKIQSVFSHLAASDAAEHDTFTIKQIELFNICSAKLQLVCSYSFLKHIANTSAIHRHPGAQFDMVRLGIGLYGVDNNIDFTKKLKTVATLKTTISQIKKINTGETIGYNRKGIAEKDITIATVRIGYADGYPRNSSNGIGYMLVNGKHAPVIGNVCMDMTMLDITNIGAEEGDEVIVFGDDLPVTTLATASQTIAYEILTGISQRVKRVYYEE